MRAFFRYLKKLHIWLLAVLAVLALFFALRGEQRVMTAVAERFSMPLERALGWVCSLFPFSVAELCYAVLVVGLPAFLVCGVRAVSRAEYKREEVYRRVMILVNTALSVYAVFCLLWGVNFYAEDFCDKSGVYPEPVSRNELIAVTRMFAEQTALFAPHVRRDADGVCAESREEILDFAPFVYEPTYREFPFLALRGEPVPKKIICSRIMSAMNVTGLYFPYTGESNLNMDFPVATFPATVAHELAHRRGVASEQQCNFLAVVACTRAQSYAYRYSGWLLGYIHLSNALYDVDPEVWREIRLSLPDTVEADLVAESDYWAQYDGAAARASSKAYDAMLRSYGDELGMRSYGAVVDLLVAYYK
jgi:hypothetical protein